MPLLNVKAERLSLVVPADRLMLAPLAPEIVMLWPFWERVMLLPPAKTIVPVDMSVLAPAVLPPMLAFIRPPLSGAW
jgi:hypothetical protein